ncbi:MAG: DNA helicase UvrC [Eggerthellaceae bacterium]|nr:DNA helicase UvrC [Eggerthellaceae bacterium]
MDLEKQVKIIDTIRETLEGYMGQELKVRANMGRSKIVESEGTLMQIHPQLFIMELKRKRGRTSRQSYQYVDVLTGTVELLQNGEPIFAPFITETLEESIEIDLEEALQVDMGEAEEDTEEEHVVL